MSGAAPNIPSSGSNPVPGSTPGGDTGTPPPTTGSSSSGQTQGAQQGAQAAGGDAAVAEFFSALDNMADAAGQPDTMGNLQQQAMDNARVVSRGTMAQQMHAKTGQESQARTDTAKQASDHQSADQTDDSSRSNYRDTRASTRSGDTRSGDRADARFSDLVQGGRRSAQQGADKANAGRRAAVLNSMRARSGENPEAQRGRILQQTRTSDAQAQKALQNLPPNIRQSLQANGRTDQALNFLKFQMQMQRLQQLKQQAQQSGDTELASQIEQAMADLQAEAPEMPAELADVDSGDAAEGTEDGVEDGDDAGDGGDTDDAGESTGLRRSQTVDDAGDSGDDSDGSGDGNDQPETGGHVAANLAKTSTVSITGLRESNVGVIHAGGSDGAGTADGDMSFDSAVLSRLRDGTLITTGSQGRVRLLRVREREARSGGHSLDDIGLGGGDSSDSSEPTLSLAHVDSGSTTYFRTSDGRLLSIDQLRRQANEYLAEHPNADHIMIGDRRVGIDDITPNEAARSGISRAELNLALRNGVVRRQFSARAQHLNPVHYQQTGMYSGMAFA